MLDLLLGTANGAIHGAFPAQRQYPRRPSAGAYSTS